MRAASLEKGLGQASLLASPRLRRVKQKWYKPGIRLSNCRCLLPWPCLDTDVLEISSGCLQVRIGNTWGWKRRGSG